jgi:hypothetical protein
MQRFRVLIYPLALNCLPGRRLPVKDLRLVFDTRESLVPKQISNVRALLGNGS